MTYVAGTKMVRDFYGLEQLSTKDRNKAIKELDKVYAYGWRKEEDGRVRWVVDEVPDTERKSLLTSTHDGRSSGERPSTCNRV